MEVGAVANTMTLRTALRSAVQALAMLLPPWLIAVEVWRTKPWPTVAASAVCIVVLGLTTEGDNRREVFATLLWLIGLFGLINTLRLPDSIRYDHSSVLIRLIVYAALFLVGLLLRGFYRKTRSKST